MLLFSCPRVFCFAGHAFGKAHGACLEPPCGDGKGPNTFTSGWEGYWTTNPTQWDNSFFTNLVEFEWELIDSPGGNKQWKPKDGPEIMMLTSDLALAMHTDYKPIAQMYAENPEKLDEDFAKVWYKLVTADMGPSSRCIGDDIPEPQPFQNDVPRSPAVLPDYVPIRQAIEGILEKDDTAANEFIHLAYNCAATFRATDYHGGCNGARIRLSPEKDWPENAGTAATLEKLEPIKEMYDGVSYADLIVLAGITALEHENPSVDLAFCGGNVDSDAAHNGKDLSPRHYRHPLVTILDDWQVKGLMPEEGVALACRKQLGSQYFQDLLEENGNFSEYELAMVKNEDLKKIVEKFATNENMLLKTFEAAWTKMMTADRFAGYKENACTGVDTKTK